MNWKIERRQLDTITEYPHNPRVITKKGLADLKRSIDKFGLAEPLVINTDGILIGGHARYQVLKSQGVTEVDAYVPERELSEEEYRELNIRLNRNIAGSFDFDILANEFDLPDLIEWGFELTDFDLNDSTYSRDTKTPIYEPSNDKPILSELINNNKTNELIIEIEKSGISDDEKQFLILSAYRHNVFDYSKIADYYANSTGELQELMQKSALVIIDFDKAIENGFVETIENILDIQAEDYAE